MTSIVPHNHLPETGFLRLPQVLQIVPVGKSTWWAGVKDGRYPKGQKLSPRTTAWKIEDIRALIAELSNEGGSA
jgi:prophage regulatory protein